MFDKRGWHGPRENMKELTGLIIRARFRVTISYGESGSVLSVQTANVVA